MKVFFAPAAKLDLLSIGENIGQENPTRAISFVDELIDRCYTLADLPRRYPLVPRYEHWGIRRRVYGNYLIFIGCARMPWISSTSCTAQWTTNRCYFPMCEKGFTHWHLRT